LAITIVFPPIINLLVKKPVLAHMLSRFNVSSSMATWPWWFALLALLLVGVSEEAIKLAPVLAPSVRKEVRARNSAVPMAFAIGLGFALGEIWYLAYRIHFQDPATARLPVYMLGGFVSERIATLVLHSFFVLLALRGLLISTPRFLIGGAAAVAAHALVDATALLYQMKRISAEPAILVLMLTTIACALPFWAYGRRLTSLERSAMVAEGGRILYVGGSSEAGGPKGDDV
jgi:uncharacterized membrane protein YhfC